MLFQIGDQREFEISDFGPMLFFNPETEEEQWVDTSSYAFKKWFKEYHELNQGRIDSLSKSGRIELIKIFTQEDHGEAIVRFFQTRARHKK